MKNNNEHQEQMSNKLNYFGFGKTLHNDLKEKMQTGAAFELPYVRQFGRDLVQAVLFFGYKEEQYYFNRFSMTLYGDGAIDPLQQTFFISRSFVQFSFLEAYNLLKSRSVYKEKVGPAGKQRPAWLRLNDNEVDGYGNKRFHIYNEDSYHYDLATEIKKYPIEELKDKKVSAKLLHALQQGNRVAVTFNVNGAPMNYFAEAMPHVRSLEFYDKSHNKVFNLTENV